jgi:putative membrane protein
MILESILLVFVGIGIGVFAGLTPGIHVNTTIPIIMSLAFLLPSPYYLAVLVVSVAVTEMFIDYIPSIFLGAPEADTSLSVLPGHRLLLEGRGFEAIKLTILGGVGTLIVSLIFIALFANYFELLYEVTRPYVQYLIMGVMVFMVATEKKLKKMLSSILILSITGLFGILVLNSYLVPAQEVLFPSLTGLFGLSTLIVSISERSSIPEQKEDSRMLISKKEIIKSLFLASVAGIAVGFLPAVGISEAGTMVQYLGGGGGGRSFLITISGINVANDAFSLVSLFLVGNPRSGASVAIQGILGELLFFDVLFLVGVIMMTAGIAAILTGFLGKIIPKYLEKANYKILIISVIVFITSLVLFLTNPFGLLILFTSTCLGLLCNFLEIRRSHCMGILLIPSLLFFTNLNGTVLSILGI